MSGSNNAGGGSDNNANNNGGSSDNGTKDQNNGNQNGNGGQNDHSQNGANNDANQVPKTWEDFFKHPRFTELSKTATQLKNEKEQWEKEKNDAANAKKLEEGKHVEIINELKPKAERATELEKTLKGVVDTEMQAIPEERRGLVPTTLPVEQQLAYISANRAFLMGSEKKQNMNKSTNPGGGNGGNDDKPTFTQAQISDSKFFAEHEKEIMEALADNRIVD